MCDVIDQKACICRNIRGKEAFEKLRAKAPDLPECWRAASEIASDGRPVQCGLCEPRWQELIIKAKDCATRGCVPA